MRIVIQNFQSLGHVDVTVAGLTVLVGPSNRGKSALVRAVEAALFNKPGDEYIRTGKKKTEVELIGAPGLLHQLIWTKTKTGKAVYQHGVERYSKVQGGTPPSVTAAGYRDIWVGDKDRKKGEWLRPQVSAQHDPIFLLTRSGSFVSDVLGAISRHAVLLTAQGRATGDHRSTKQAQGYKQTDLTAAQTQLDLLGNVPALAARVESLRVAYVARDALAATVAKVKALLGYRALYAPVAAVELPAAPDSPWLREGRLDFWLGDVTRGSQLVAYRPVRLALGGSELPAPAVVPVDLGDTVRRAQALLAPRPAYAALAGIYTVTGTAVTEAAAAERQLGVVAKAKGLFSHRPHVAVLAAASSRPEPTPFLDALYSVLAMYQSVGAVVAKREPALDMLRRCETAVRATKVEVDEAQAVLATVLAEIQTCPTCEQPWPR